MNTLLLKKFNRWPSTAVIDKFVEGFQNMYRISNVVEAFDGSHISIITSRLHAADYYNCKGFHPILLQDMISSKCIFWDFDIGWAGSMHDPNLWGGVMMFRRRNDHVLHGESMVNVNEYEDDVYDEEPSRDQ